MLHNLAAPAAATIVSVATGLNDGDLSNLKVSPNFSFFPFMDLVSNMVGGLWAAQHDACLVLSIPTNDAARHMNEKVGYDVLPPQVALCIEVTDDDNAITCCFPVDGVVPDVCRAFHIVAQPKWMPRAVGQGTVKGTGAHDDGGGITPEWMYRAVVS